MTRYVEKNLWIDTCENTQAYPALTEDRDVDVVVIGAGYSGLSAALHLAENKVDVAVLEAQEIGYGGSGRNVGLVNAGLWLKPDEITDRLGKKDGEVLIRFLGSAPETVFGLIDTYQIKCEAIKNGTLHCADSQKGLAELNERQQQWQKFGYSLDLLSREKTAELMGADKYIGALHDLRAGSIQPLSYACGLAQAAVSLGASIFCHSPVRSITKAGQRWRVKTDKGTLNAQKIITATGTYNENGDTWASPDTTSLYYFQMATAPLSEALQQTILPEKHAAWDTHMVLTSFRLNREGRMIVGSVGCLDGAGYGTHKSWAYRKMLDVYPQLAGYAFTHEWYGRIGLTNNNIPRLAEPYPGWLTVWGYNGRGIAPGTVFGRALAESTLSGDTSTLPLKLSPSEQENFIKTQSFFIELGAAARHFIEKRV
ncbi:NAD(P)/FAD-dependent oxidoreductase [Sedimenticola sp.]|uniref:NAD(P)/FAD-dependent oxidoreductase n=1 Tax=Sedimenticola sp. TaxID=1940285 RepID=UPI003D1035DA